MGLTNHSFKPSQLLSTAPTPTTSREEAAAARRAPRERNDGGPRMVSVGGWVVVDEMGGWVDKLVGAARRMGRNLALGVFAARAGPCFVRVGGEEGASPLVHPHAVSRARDTKTPTPPVGRSGQQKKPASTLCVVAPSRQDLSCVGSLRLVVEGVAAHACPTKGPPLVPQGRQHNPTWARHTRQGIQHLDSLVAAILPDAPGVREWRALPHHLMLLPFRASSHWFEKKGGGGRKRSVFFSCLSLCPTSFVSTLSVGFFAFWRQWLFMCRCGLLLSDFSLEMKSRLFDA